MIVKVEPAQAAYDAMCKQLGKFGKRGVAHEVMRKAIKETAQSVKRILPEDTREMYTIKRSAFKKSDIKVDRVSTRLSGAILRVAGPTMGIRKNYRNRKNAKKKSASVMVKKDGRFKDLTLNESGKEYKAFVATLKNKTKGGEEISHDEILRREPGKYMKNDKRPLPTKRMPKKKRKPREAVKVFHSLSRSKAAEMAYKHKVSGEASSELIYHMQKCINEVIGGIK